MLELGDSDYQVRQGEPDVRGWQVVTTQGLLVGNVTELLIDRAAQKASYLVVALATEQNQPPYAVLVPVGPSVLQAPERTVLVPHVPEQQLLALPAYEKGQVTSAMETMVLRVFMEGHVHVPGSALPGQAPDLPNGIIDQHEPATLRKPIPEITLTPVEKQITEVPLGPAAEKASLRPFQEGALVLPELTEIPVVTKQAFVVEEVVLHKETDEQETHVHTSARSTAVDVQLFNSTSPDADPTSTPENTK